MPIILRDIATCPYALSCPLSLTSDPVLGWSMSEKSLVTCSGSWAFGRHIEFKMAPNFAQDRKILRCFLPFIQFKTIYLTSLSDQEVK